MSYNNNKLTVVSVEVGLDTKSSNTNHLGVICSSHGLWGRLKLYESISN